MGACGCMGLPIEPPVWSSNECYNKYAKYLQSKKKLSNEIDDNKIDIGRIFD